MGAFFKGRTHTLLNPEFIKKLQIEKYKRKKGILESHIHYNTIHFGKEIKIKNFFTSKFFEFQKSLYFFFVDPNPNFFGV